MEQYLNLVWKNYTASLADHSLDENDDTSDLFVNNSLHYNIPFWVGVTVITLLCLSAIIATIRYCICTLCSSHTETEKLALVPSKSPCSSSSVVTTIQRQRRQVLDNQHLTDDTEISSSSPGQSRDHHANISIIPIVRQYTRSHLTSTGQSQREVNRDNVHDSYFSSTHIASSRAPSNDFRKKIHDIYVLPVSPALSSSSSTTNTDEIIRTGSNTMPIRSRRHLPGSVISQNDSTYHGIKNACFAHSPQLKTRTLPRSRAGTLRRIHPPSQPPPLPPSIAQLHFNDNKQSSYHHDPPTGDLDLDRIAFRFDTTKENHMKKPVPPPVPCRTQKPSALPIGFEELTKASDTNGFRRTIESSPQDDCSEHTWPKPPESMSTSEISGRLSIPYDHLMPTVIMRENSTTNVLHQHRHNEHSIFTESKR